MAIDHDSDEVLETFAEISEILVHALDTPNMNFQRLVIKIYQIRSNMQELVPIFHTNINLPKSMTVQGEFVCLVDSCVFLGSVIGSDGRSFPKVRTHL